MGGSVAVRPRFQTAAPPHIIAIVLDCNMELAMTILVTGSTGTIGSQVGQLAF